MGRISKATVAAKEQAMPLRKPKKDAWNPTHEECEAATRLFLKRGGVIEHVAVKAVAHHHEKRKARPLVAPKVLLALVGDGEQVYQENEDTEE